MYSLFHLSPQTHKIFLQSCSEFWAVEEETHKKVLCSHFQFCHVAWGSELAALVKGWDSRAERTKAGISEDHPPHLIWVLYPPGCPSLNIGLSVCGCSVRADTFLCSRESTICFQVLWPKQHSSTSGTLGSPSWFFPISPYWTVFISGFNALSSLKIFYGSKIHTSL